MSTQIAGIRIPDSSLARQAEQLVLDTSPDFLVEHCRRSHVYSALLGQAMGVPYDDELLYLAAILHDLGLTERFATGERLEVAGARAAADFARQAGVPEDDTDCLWDAIALHSSVGIADAKGGEVALTHYGVLLDVVGLRLEMLPDGAVDEVLTAYPRRNFKRSLHQLLLQHAAKEPMAYAFTWLHDTVRTHVAPLPSFDEAFFGAPFDE